MHVSSEEKNLKNVYFYKHAGLYHVKEALITNLKFFEMMTYTKRQYTHNIYIGD